MNKIALVSSIRDCPDPYLQFWIQYHLGIGVDHIFIYDNESDTPIVVENPKVTVTRWPGKAGQGRGTHAGPFEGPTVPHIRQPSDRHLADLGR